MSTYNHIIRKITVGFGDLFSKISLVRYNPDLTEAERFIVPIAYAPKELYVQRIEGDYNLDKKVQMTLPRLSYELTGMSYDATRKQITNIKNAYNTSNGVVAQYNPVPYNFSFSLHLYTRNIEDAHQIIEHILPYFTPDYTIKINLIPELGVIKEIPIVLNTTNFDITYEGPRDSDTRTIIWTLDFTVKGFIFGQTSTPKIISTSITNILNDILVTDNINFNMSNTGLGSYQTGEFVYQGSTLPLSTASAKVVSWSAINNQLTLTNINGNFVSSKPIVGATTNANYIFNSYELPAQRIAQVIEITTPTDANASSLYSYNTIINEVPNTSNNIVNTNNFSGDLLLVLGKDDLYTELENPIDLGS
jgi:hypothetical protein